METAKLRFQDYLTVKMAECLTSPLPRRVRLRDDLMAAVVEYANVYDVRERGEEGADWFPTCTFGWQEFGQPKFWIYSF